MNLARIVACCAALACSQVSAQVSSVAQRDLSGGVTLPPTGAALIDSATALSLDPAALSYVGGLELEYLHERNNIDSRTGDGLFLATRLLGLGLGFSVEWLRGTQLPDYRRTSWGLSLGNEMLSLGLAYRFYSSRDDTNLDRIRSLDLSLSSRPARYLSLAAVVRNMDQARQGPPGFGRSYDFGVGVRPFGERYTMGVDLLFPEASGISAGRLAYTLQAELTRGLMVGAGLSQDFTGANPLVFQVGLTLNGPYYGLGYAAGARNGTLAHVLGVRFSSQAWRAGTTFQGRYALFDLHEMLSGAANRSLTLLGIGQPNPYLAFTQLLEHAIRDPDLRGVVVKIDQLPDIGVGRAEELRQALWRLRKAGKKVVAILYNAEDSDYLVASAAEHIYAVSEAALLINGFSANVVFLGGTMDKLDVHWDVAKIGPYKNAPDQLTRADMSPEQRETINAYLDADVRHFQKVVGEARKLNPEQIQAIWKEGLVSPRRAKELGLVDEIIDPQTI